MDTDCKHISTDDISKVTAASHLILLEENHSHVIRAENIELVFDEWQVWMWTTMSIAAEKLSLLFTDPFSKQHI